MEVVQAFTFHSSGIQIVKFQKFGYVRTPLCHPKDPIPLVSVLDRGKQ